MKEDKKLYLQGKIYIYNKEKGNPCSNMNIVLYHVNNLLKASER